MTFGSIALAPLISGYLRIYPQVEVALDLTDRYVDVVGEGYDAVIRLGPLKDSELITCALVPYQLIACASPAYLATRGTPRTPADLVAHECLGFVFASGQPFSECASTRRGRFTRSRCAAIQVNDARVLKAAALEGQGVILQANLILADDLAAAGWCRSCPIMKRPRAPCTSCSPRHVHRRRRCAVSSITLWAASENFQAPGSSNQPEGHLPRRNGQERDEVIEQADVISAGCRPSVDCQAMYHPARAGCCRKPLLDINVRHSSRAS